MKQSQSMLHGRIHHVHAWRRPDNLSLCEVHVVHFFKNAQKYSSWVNSTGTNCKPILQCKHSTMSTVRWAVKTTWQVVHCRLVSLLLQCFCSPCFVYEGMPHQLLCDCCPAPSMLPRSSTLQFPSSLKTQSWHWRTGDSTSSARFKKKCRLHFQFWTKKC